MTTKVKIQVSKEAHAAAEKDAFAAGFATADEYVEALLLEDYDAITQQPWFRQKIEEGEASPIVGELTPARVTQLVQQGIERAKRRK